MSEFDALYREQETWGHIYAVVCDVVAFVILAILIIHCINVYQDIYTKERKSVSHRRKPPVITSSYKLIAFLTICSVAFYFAAATASAIISFAKTDKECYQSGASVVIFIQLAKSSMYMVFLARLHTIFHQSAYKYPFKCIMCFAVTLCLYGLFVIIFMIVAYAAIVYTYGHHKYPNFCGPGSSEMFPILAGMIIIEDLGSATGFLIAFMIPLKKTLKAIGNEHDDPKVTRKIIYAGTKTTVLTGVAMVSTLGFLFLTAGFMAIFAIFDILVNPICMVLMTAYYPDDKYYRKLCCCCIACCDKRTKVAAEEERVDDLTTKENEPTRTEIVSSTAGTNATETGPSVDTMSQLRVAGGDTKVTYQPNNNNHNDNDNVELQ